MACSLTRAEVSDRILIVLRTVHRDDTISEETTFGRDLDVDDLAKELYYYPIKMTVEQIGCVMGKSFSPDACRKARKVSGIIKAAWDSL
jgi:hypothetical protein